MKKLLLVLLTLCFSVFLITDSVFAAGGIFPKGGGTVSVGQTFTISVTASGDAFDSLQGVISVSGPVSVVSFSPGSATWLPGKAPAEGSQFVGIVSSTASLQVASIKLKANSVGGGAVNVNGVKLASNGAIVGESGGSASFTVKEAAPKAETTGAVSVQSTSHADPNQGYESTTIDLSWGAVAKATGYSYLLDQTADTTPPDTLTSADTTASYPDKAPGIYYFHIKAKSGNGFGPVTHFKINIKEPEAKINDKLNKPSNVLIVKNKDFTNDINAGTVKGFTISGKTEPGYSVNIILDPAPTLPNGKEFTVVADKDGNFSYLVDFPVKAGFYKLTVQGQKDKTLTPESDEIKFELTLGNSGDIRILDNNDVTKKPVDKKASVLNKKIGLIVGGLLALILIAGYIVMKRRRNKLMSYKKSQLISTPSRSDLENPLQPVKPIVTTQPSQNASGGVVDQTDHKINQQ